MLIPTAVEQVQGGSSTSASMMLGYLTPTTSNVFGAGNAFGVRVWLPYPATFSNWLLRIGTQSGNMDLGVFNASDGSAVRREGSFAVPASGRVVRALAGGSLTLPAGAYVLAAQADNGTATIGLLGTATQEAIGVTPVNTFPLPSTLTLTVGGTGISLALIP